MFLNLIKKNLFVFLVLFFINGFSFDVVVEPVRPNLEVEEIGDNFVNVTFIPGTFDTEKQTPVGNTFYVKYRENEDHNWQVNYI